MSRLYLRVHPPIGATGLFLLSGYDGIDRLLSAAREAGVGHVVLLSSSSVVGTDTDNAVAAYHLASEAAVERSGMAWTFLRPNSAQWATENADAFA
jgi:uncharacterized protein YbjT (DUF2867 family)